MALRGAVVAVAAVLGTIGSASTAPQAPVSLTPKGDGAGAVSGITAESIDYTIVGADITSVEMVLAGDTRETTIRVAFNRTSPAACSERGVYDQATNLTSYSCAVIQKLAAATTLTLTAG